VRERLPSNTIFLGSHIQESEPLGTTNYLYDGDNIVSELDNGGSVLAKHTDGQRIDEPLAEIRSGTASFYEQDGLGSVASLSNGTGALSSTYVYDSFGNVSTSTGTVANPFRYTGREFDSETGLNFHRARYYDPTTGRFISEDPTQFGAGINFYGYTLESPTNFRDPDGLDIAVIENGPTEGNPVGHTAIAITGQGVYSFGNSTKCGTSLRDYLRREAPRRNTTIYVIKTTPAQDAAALAYLKAQGKCDRTLPITFGNCASISNGALTAADIFSLPSVDPVTGEPGIPSDFVPGTAGLRATAAGATSVSVPQNSPTLPGGLEGFEPK